MTPASVVRAAGNTVVSADALIRIISDKTVFIVIVRAKGTSLNARCVFALLALNQQIDRTTFFRTENTNIGCGPVSLRNALVVHFREIGLRTGQNAGTAADALCGIKKMR